MERTSPAVDFALHAKSTAGEVGWHRDDKIAPAHVLVIIFVEERFCLLPYTLWNVQQSVL